MESLWPILILWVVAVIFGSLRFAWPHVASSGNCIPRNLPGRLFGTSCKASRNARTWLRFMLTTGMSP